MACRVADTHTRSDTHELRPAHHLTFPQQCSACLNHILPTYTVRVHFRLTTSAVYLYAQSVFHCFCMLGLSSYILKKYWVHATKRSLLSPQSSIPSCTPPSMFQFHQFTSASYLYAKLILLVCPTHLTPFSRCLIGPNSNKVTECLRCSRLRIRQMCSESESFATMVERNRGITGVSLGNWFYLDDGLVR